MGNDGDHQTYKSRANGNLYSSLISVVVTNTLTTGNFGEEGFISAQNSGS